MSGIKKRRIFVDVHSKNGDNFHKFWDWAMVVTEIGSMAEPFQVGQKYPICTTLAQDYDPEDEMVRVDEIEFSEPDHSLLGGSGTEEPLVGGVLMTRDGR
jgi:hypothetical protein